jgi:transcriptional regulator of heat shock response
MPPKINKMKVRIYVDYLLDWNLITEKQWRKILSKLDKEGYYYEVIKWECIHM